MNSLGKQCGQIIGPRDDVGGQIGSNLRDTPSEADEESKTLSSRIVPLCGQLNRVPDVSAIHDFSRGCRYYAEESQDKADQWKEESLPVDAVRLPQISGEVGDVGGHCRPAARHCHHARHDQPRSLRTVYLVF